MEKENIDEKEIEKDIHVDKVKEAASIFLNNFNDNITQSSSGIGSYIKEDETNETWYYADSKEHLLTNYALIALELSNELEVSVFDLLLNVQTKLAGAYPEEYVDFTNELERIKKEGSE